MFFFPPPCVKSKNVLIQIYIKKKSLWFLHWLMSSIDGRTASGDGDVSSSCQRSLWEGDRSILEIMVSFMWVEEVLLVCG